MGFITFIKLNSLHYFTATLKLQILESHLFEYQQKKIKYLQFKSIPSQEFKNFNWYSGVNFSHLFMWMSFGIICIDFYLEFLYSSTICSNNSCKSFIAWLYFYNEFDNTKTYLSVSVLRFTTSFNKRSSTLDSSFSCSNLNIFSHM